MDGNTTTEEEEHFVDAIDGDMPGVLTEIRGVYAQLNKIDSMVAEIRKNQEPKVLEELKREIEDAALKVDQNERLVNKLENEIIEWDAHRKLCKRDEELEEIEMSV